MLSKTKVILRLRDVIARTGLSRSTIYLRMSEGSFPSAISFGGRSIGWLEAEVDAWVDACIDRSRKEREASRREFDSGEDKRPALGL